MYVMKISILILLCLIFSVENVCAQNNGISECAMQKEDTLKLCSSKLVDSYAAYSFRQVNWNERSRGVSYPSVFNRDSLVVTQNSQLTLDLNEPQKKRNFFHSPYAKFIIPTTFISYGILARKTDLVRRLDQNTTNEIKEHYLGTFPIDNYTQYLPAVAVYGLDLFGVKAKHNFRDRTFVMATSYLLMAATVLTMKATIDAERPDGSANNSFPSGHAATAFVGAQILFREYKDVSPWIGIAGYTVAAGTAAFRVVNKRHWISDVVAGAGIGMLSVELAYMLMPTFHRVLGLEDSGKNLAITPAISAESYGLGMVYTF